MIRAPVIVAFSRQLTGMTENVGERISALVLMACRGRSLGTGGESAAATLKGLA